jgi:hypothetical protein
MRFLPIAGLCAALAGSMVSPSGAQEEKFARSTYPLANARPDGSRDLNPIANISGLWRIAVWSTLFVLTEWSRVYLYRSHSNRIPGTLGREGWGRGVYGNHIRARRNCRFYR